MTDDETSKENSPKQANVIDMIPDRFTYDVKQLTEFMKMVFHAEAPRGANILTWAVAKQTPAFPISLMDLVKRLSRSSKAMPLYFGTSTTRRDPDDDKLYNRKALFESFHVLVLDDIGKKVPFDKIPESFDPTYKIETSPGSYHYGYVLEKPILNEAHAAMLVQLAYDAGFSDKGGKMATKLVRLPDGINGKLGGTPQFKVRLDDMEGPYWTPETILEELNVGVTWADIVKDVDAVARARATVSTGTSAWSPIGSVGVSLEGIVDPALEVLYAKNMVKQETNEWVTIKCPQAHLHSDGDGTAGYSPMGWGGPAFENRRGFHCFHEHCAAYKIQNFLAFIRNISGFELAVSEDNNYLVKRYVYDPSCDGSWDIMTGGAPRLIQQKAFANLWPRPASIPHASDPTKTRSTTESRLYLTNPARVTVTNSVYDVSNPNRIIKGEYGNVINRCEFPAWGDGEFDQEYVDFFTKYLKYLIPDDDDRAFFIDWLSAKVQDMAFRGPAIIMIAPQQGTGRGLLAKMLTLMFGDTNVTEQPFDVIVGTARWNHWMSNALVIVNETRALDDTASAYKAAERLKERVDTSPTPVTIDLKNVGHYREMNHTSYLMFSNNANALQLAHDDRRFYVMDNNPFRADNEYFKELFGWKDAVDAKGVPVWCQSIWRWLRSRDVDVGKLVAPVLSNEAKDNMVGASKQPIDIAIETIMRCWPCDLIAQNQVAHILAEVQMGMHYENQNKAAFALKSVFRQQVVKIKYAKGATNRYLVNGQNGTGLWVVRARINDKVKAKFITQSASRRAIDIEREKMPEAPFTEMVALVKNALNSHDL